MTGSVAPRDFSHQTVLRDEVVRAIAPRAGGVYADVTLGGGGHAEAILAAAECRVIGLDRDDAAIAATTSRLAKWADRMEIKRGRFGDAATLLPSGLDGLVADLGVSSPQLDDPARGMSFRREASAAPLDMRMDRSQGRTARELIAALSEEELANVIFELGEERASRRIARSIKRAEGEGNLETTGDLRHAIYQAVGGDKRTGIDPATRTFQALRIAVNEELAELDALLAALPALLARDGVAAIISFHSLEDRRVKRAFSDATVWAPLSKKPIEASGEEIVQNPRARSAKLRVARRRGEGETELDAKAAKYAARKARKFGGAS
ncbi:MAG: 16S rRNA (cytosine(1402)-N(4))-methyltransferase RsmH [Deltaproteobacteria bacterium]|nr:16S rRNA (cytosine(1402)-N(4))-methyltransferase RsmH [Deltaproteobacteria bacterium]